MNFKADPGGTSGIIQINGVDKLSVNADGSIVALDPVVSGDTTEGRLLQVGDFGIGTTACPTIDDANDAVLSGVYAGPGGTGVNFPGSTKYGVLFVGTRTGTIIMQVAVYSTQMYKRRSTDGGVTWDDWTLMYDQKTILGAVSQSAGVPTGAIIESGSNSAGSYTKFADGTLLCSGVQSGTSGSFADIYLTLPITATEYTHLTCIENGSGVGNSGESGQYFSIRSTRQIPFSGNTAIINLQDGYKTRLVSTAYNLSFFAIGRWF
jgi:hypothetical protein